MGFVNWHLVGFWGCALFLVVTLMDVMGMYARDSHQPSDTDSALTFLNLIVGFIGLCLFGGWLWP